LLEILAEVAPGGRQRQVQAEDILRLIGNNLGRREIVLFPEFDLPLAFFGEDARNGLWKRLLTEIIDRPGVGVLLLAPDSRLLPSGQQQEHFGARIRGPGVA
jgi:hypothetical protein